MRFTPRPGDPAPRRIRRIGRLVAILAGAVMFIAMLWVFTGIPTPVAAAMDDALWAPCPAQYLAARTAVYHQQQGLGRRSGQTAPQPLDHPRIEPTALQRHQGAAGSGQAGQQIHRRGGQLGVEVPGQGGEGSHQLGPGPHRQTTGHPFQGGEPQWGGDRSLQPAQQHGPGSRLALVAQQWQQRCRHGLR